MLGTELLFSFGTASDFAALSLVLHPFSPKVGVYSRVFPRSGTFAEFLIQIRKLTF